MRNSSITCSWLYALLHFASYATLLKNEAVSGYRINRAQVQSERFLSYWCGPVPPSVPEFPQ